MTATDARMDPITDDVAAVLLERAAALEPLLREEADANEALGRLGDATIDALRAADLLCFTAPKELGGHGVGQVDALRIFERLMTAESSAGWVPMVTNLCVMFLPYLEPEVAQRFCTKGLPLIAGQGAPAGIARPVDGGYRLRGRWSYGSGIHFTDYVLASCVLLGDDGSPVMDPKGAPETRIFLVSSDEIELHGNWDVLGMEATGSVDYSIADAFVVPEVGVDLREKPVFGGPSMAAEFPSWAMIVHSAAALGIARHALDEAAKIVVQPKELVPPPAEGESLQIAFAKAEATLRSARAFVFEFWEELETTIAAGDEITTRQETLQRLTLLHATDAAEQVATAAFRFGGGTALRSGPLQRCFRDMQSIRQHILVSDQFWKYCGEELVGVADGKAWSLYGLG